MKDIKVAIIGAGWYGCHLAYAFKKKGIDVKIFEKNSKIFNEASFYNQNRLHNGFHYPRSFKTRLQSKRGFRLFNIYYPELISNMDLSLYAIAENKSIIDFQTYKSIMSSSELSFEDVSESVPIALNNIEGVIDTNEKIIDSEKSKLFFENKLEGIIIKENKISINEINKLKIDGYKIIDCTWNKIFSNKLFYYESTIIFKYLRKYQTNFGLTIMDGLFSSIYPIDKKYATLSDVEYTPFFKTSSYTNAYKAIQKITSDKINDIRKNMENKIINYFPQFNEHFEFVEPIFSVKTKKLDNNSDDRSSYLMKLDENIYSVFSGKIDTIFDIEYQLISTLF